MNEINSPEDEDKDSLSFKPNEEKPLEKASRTVIDKTVSIDQKSVTPSPNSPSQPKPSAPSTNQKPKDDKKAEEESKDVVDKISEKAEAKIEKQLQDQVQKTIGADGDKKEGLKELYDIAVEEIERAVDKHQQKRSGVAAGTRAQNVSTTVGNTGSVSPVNVSNPNAAVSANAVPTPPPSTARTVASASAPSNAVLRSAAGHGTPPVAAPSVSSARVAGGITEELMEASKALSKRVYQGAKASKNIRAAGVAALASAAGFGIGKVKNRNQKAEFEYNRQRALRQSLMSDG